MLSCYFFNMCVLLIVFFVLERFYHISEREKNMPRVQGGKVLITSSLGRQTQMDQEEGKKCSR